MAPPTRLCHVCGALLDSPAERNRHVEHDHPGTSIEWRGPRKRELWIVEPGRPERQVPVTELRRMRAAARRGDPPAPNEVGVPADPEPALAEHETPETLGEPAPRVGPQREPRPRVAPSSLPVRISREAIATEITPDMLASVVRGFSVALSEWDGAGEPGYLSAIECKQIALLIQDPTIDLVARYFRGSVSRFKLAVAVVMIGIGKGPVHARAIARKYRRNPADDVAAVVAAASVDEPTAIAIAPEPVVEPSRPETPLERLARLQREDRSHAA